mmetsp:Transcript_3853/g.5586  ORF Transcript_3853/g.5586 Transcript_3853/m.5586 type:complete len:400 (-) Transcript_3853:1035-2234(-)|eukprot:CAMPEP_0203748420 /NCGR_PEP_ID=MMETSP0098-20131031/3310_1 /ASSEMBLY_ACC=CAM_ASM_000208 /TAXON_ID=96639 /ORGANISM=" , Strain NY0313808BC1" /LENGTH=399 /DNA_ID=CAMNT_0050637161 /DNA_START=251 /DNA_END=1450 /DNA_ORIENTATION=+
MPSKEYGHGKNASWKAHARYEIDKELAKRSRRGTGRSKEFRPSFTQLMFDHRLLTRLAEKKQKRKMAALKKPDIDEHIFWGALLNKKMCLCAGDPKIGTLLSLCARLVVRMFPHFDEEDAQHLSYLPWPIKCELLKQASILSIESNGKGTRRRLLVNDLVFGGLVDNELRSLSLCCSKITDDFVESIEPQLVNKTRCGFPSEREQGDIEDSWEFTPLDGVAIVGCPYLVNLDISFCKNLSEDVVERIGKACPTLQSLSLCGNFNDGDRSYYLLQTLCEDGLFAALRYLDLGCCSWLSFELLLQSRFLDSANTVRMKSLEKLNAYQCREITEVATFISMNLEDEKSKQHVFVQKFMESFVVEKSFQNHAEIDRVNFLPTFIICGRECLDIKSRTFCIVTS